MEKILLINIPDYTTVEQIAEKLHFRCVRIMPKDFIKTLGELAGFQTSVHTNTVSESDGIPAEGILVMCNMKNSHIDRLLKSLRTAAMQNIYKAILTPTNADWNIYQLAKELMRERRQLEQ